LLIGSHRLFPEHYLQSNDNKIFYKERLKEIDGDDWLEVDPHDNVLFQSGSVVTCLLEPGDVLIWDSRTVHCSYPSEEKMQRKGSTPLQSHGLIRAAGLINMIPRGKCSQAIRNERLKAIDSSRTLTHWVDKAAPLGEERSEDADKEDRCVGYMKTQQKHMNKVLLSYEDLSAAQKQLV